MTWVAIIEKKKPIPARGPQKGYTAALRKLEVGDSVFIPCGPGPLYSYRKLAGLLGKSTTRREGEGYRVWRTE